MLQSIQDIIYLTGNKLKLAYTNLSPNLNFETVFLQILILSFYIDIQVKAVFCQTPNFTLHNSSPICIHPFSEF